VAPTVIDIRSVEDSRSVMHQAVQALTEGRLVAFPTETVYGLAASALNEDAVAQLVKAKGRGADNPLTLAIKNAGEAMDYVPNLSSLGQRLTRRCWPGPLTLVAANHDEDSLLHRLPPGVQQTVMPTGTIGLRVPAHEMILDVMQMLTGPLVLTSANKSGSADATTAEQVVEELGDAVSLILDGGRSRFGQPSSVIHVDGSRYEVLREGVVSAKNVKRLLSFIVLLVCTGNTCRSPMAELWARKLLADRLGCGVDDIDEHGVIVTSAGIAAMGGGGASPEAVEIMLRDGLDLSGHGTQPVSEKLVRHADLILTMTQGHRQAIISGWPTAAARTSLVRHDNQDISDPIGGPLEFYEQCSNQIRAELEIRLKDLDLNVPQLM
jgi:protein-tyrosine phosphatase